jgi:hypothetical protein
MQTISGLVSAVNPRHFTSKAGKATTVWTAIIDNQEVEMGFEQPSFNVGDTVSLDVEMNRFNKLAPVQPGKPRNSGGPARSSGGGRAAGGGKFTPKPFPLPPTHGDTAILRQNALTNANAAVNNYLTTQGGAYDTVEDYEEQVLKTAKRFVGWTSGNEE